MDRFSKGAIHEGANEIKQRTRMRQLNCAHRLHRCRAVREKAMLVMTMTILPRLLFAKLTGPRLRCKYRIRARRNAYEAAQRRDNVASGTPRLRLQSCSLEQPRDAVEAAGRRTGQNKNVLAPMEGGRKN